MKRDLQEAVGKARRDAQMDKLLGKRLVFSVVRDEFGIDFFSRTRDGRVLNISEKVIHGRDEIIASAVCEKMPEWNGRRLWPVSKGQEILDKLKAGAARDAGDVPDENALHAWVADKLRQLIVLNGSRDQKRGTSMPPPMLMPSEAESSPHIPGIAAYFRAHAQKNCRFHMQVRC